MEILFLLRADVDVEEFSALVDVDKLFELTVVDESIDESAGCGIVVPLIGLYDSPAKVLALVII